MVVNRKHVAGFGLDGHAKSAIVHQPAEMLRKIRGQLT